jgi:hypothetical protein
LHTILHSVGNVLNKLISRSSVALSYLECWNQFGFRIHSAERPRIAAFWAIIYREVLFLLADESPDFIEFQVAAS